ncbi:MAG: hypothetical protein DRQ44_04935 [Gammaproteobacteria bacterium]|nr:MAG: hypothetical protein DRQ44_04935 [Gammaproteobacteria bacterium]
MVFKINKPFESERKISQSVIQVIELLGMYNAELARILGQQCGDIGELTSGQRCIKRGSNAWHQAALFIETYHLLFDYFDADSVAMYHWMRAHNKHLKGTPHLLIVDDNKLQSIHDYLCQLNQQKSQQADR